MIVGMDFGTTNSGIAVYDGQQVRLLPLDPANANPAVARTALYLTNDQKVAIGRQALDQYFDDNVGRPVKMERVWVGEVEVYGADMFYVTDVYVWTDVLAPGRLFLSIKSGLRDPEYQGTVIGQFYYSLENLIAVYLSLVRLRAERLLEQDVRQVVLGRPVRFSTDPQADALAQRRLLDAAFRAGFEKVYLQYEPVAAAYHYAAGVDGPQNVLVFDFGGGTLDITVMRLDGQGAREVLATGGIPVAGDIFDQKLVRAKLPRHFGEGSYYGSQGRRLPLPRWIFDVFSDWQRTVELQTPRSRALLDEIAATAEKRRAIKGLISLVANNYSLQMFDAAEEAKRRLSDDMAALIRFRGPSFNVLESVTRSEFEGIIRSEIQAVEEHLVEIVAASGLQSDQIDAVVRTGGSSNVPAFRYLLMEMFGRDKVLATDTFSSVTSGLAIIGHHIDCGESDIPGHTPEELPEHVAAESPRQNVSAVNLDLLQRRLATQEESAAAGPGGRVGLLFLTRDHRLSIDALDRQALAAGESLRLAMRVPAGAAGLGAALALDLDEPLLLATTMYRFFLTTPGYLLDLEAVGMTAAEFFHFKADEGICALGRWSAIKQKPQLLLVTSRGYARTYAVDGLVDIVEGPAPLQFDRPLPGVPAALFGAAPGDELVVLLDSGRGVRYAVEDLPLQGLQAINRRDGERLTGALVAKAERELVLVTPEGFARLLKVDWVPVPGKPNSRGRVLVSRRPVTGLAGVRPGAPCWLVTARNLWPKDPARLPIEGERTTKTHRWLRLKMKSPVLGVLDL